ncbi:hypothetical protein E2C01_015671 [Portunus trituberculatus]|uniref:Uncharacterized protein n=1 Tax=Portunus trituberculatus TaxID=210409 RepID=A0A5B7DM77_PORTR|nr:hypothetical protein [Portunus trituberculatus]
MSPCRPRTAASRLTTAHIASPPPPSASPAIPGATGPREAAWLSIDTPKISLEVKIPPPQSGRVALNSTWKSVGLLVPGEN